MNNYFYYDCHSHHLNTNPKVLSIYVAPLNFLELSLNPFLPFCLGLHPWDRDKVNFEEWCTKHQKHFLDKNCWAIGEVGLDRIKNPDPKIPEEYLLYFFNQALNLKKPLVLHIVKAHDELQGFLNKHTEFQTMPLIIHAYQASIEITTKLKAYNVYFSLGARELKRPAKASYTDLLFDRMLLESDDGSITIQECYELAAKFFNKSLSEIENKVKENFTKLFF